LPCKFFVRVRRGVGVHQETPSALSIVTGISFLTGQLEPRGAMNGEINY